MSYEIIGETIKSAISIKLGNIFKVATNQTDTQGNIIYTYPKRYKENVTNPTYPSFWIVQVDLSMTPAGLTNRNKITDTVTQRIQLDYLMNIQYRVAENTESITNLQQQLDNIGLKLITEFNDLDLELPTKVYNKTYEKVDGVGQFTFNVTVYAIPETQEETKMVILDLEENII